MRWTATAPVTWPSGQGWEQWWHHVVADTLGELRMVTSETRGGPLVLRDVPGLFEVDGQHVRLVAGEHLRPGAVYRWVPPEGASVGRAGWGLGGHPHRRDFFLEYQEAAGRDRRAELRVDGIDVCQGVTATSTLKHLAAHVAFAPERDGLLDVEVTLDWLLVRVRAQVVPAAVGEQLRVSLRLVGRGLWRPVIAPLLVPLGIAVSHLLTEETEEVADRLTHLDEDPRGDGAPDRELARIRVGADLIRDRLHQVVRSVEARPWWRGRGAGPLREAFAALPAVGEGWPSVTPAMSFGASGRWWDEEQWIFDLFLGKEPPSRRKRHAAVDREVDSWLRHQEQMLALLARKRLAFDVTPAPAGDFVAPTAAELTELLDLSWLASPWSTIRFLAKKANEDSPDPDLPPMETDEDARRFVSQMLKDLRG